jgi:hypothetical protein
LTPASPVVNGAEHYINNHLCVAIRAQKIDLTAPPHPFTKGGRSSFDALLQSRPDTFAGKLLVCDTTMFSSTASGVENLRRFWVNMIQRSERCWPTG